MPVVLRKRGDCPLFTVGESNRPGRPFFSLSSMRNFNLTEKRFNRDRLKRKKNEKSKRVRPRAGERAVGDLNSIRARPS